MPSMTITGYIDLAILQAYRYTLSSVTCTLSANACLFLLVRVTPDIQTCTTGSVLCSNVAVIMTTFSGRPHTTRSIFSSKQMYRCVPHLKNVHSILLELCFMYFFKLPPLFNIFKVINGEYIATTISVLPSLN